MMRENAVAESAMIVIAIRELQAKHHKAHEALQNWAKWSRDRRGIYPPGAVPPAIWNDAPVSKWEFEEELDYNPYQKLNIQTAEKGDRPEEEDYDEKTAVVLDERIHGHGGLSEYQRSALEVAYVTRYTPEERFHKLCNPPCQPSTFRERLGEALRFVERFA
jgi:hypothetical protein